MYIVYFAVALIMHVSVDSLKKTFSVYIKFLLLFYLLHVGVAAEA